MGSEPGESRQIVREAHAMVAGMNPRLDPGVYVFATGGEPVREALATFREAEGLSQILAIDDARAAGFAADMPMARIVLEVHSALDGCGLSSAVSTALAKAGIACNMVAAFHHDHVFVPIGDGRRAMDILQALQADEAR